jgi:hypothetical protein
MKTPPKFNNATRDGKQASMNPEVSGQTVRKGPPATSMPSMNPGVTRDGNTTDKIKSDAARKAWKKP